MDASNGPSNPPKRTMRWLTLLLPLAAALSIYAQVIHHGYVDFDDNLYTYDNANVRSGLSLGGARWAFRTTYAANYHPLTWLSHMLDHELFGDRPGLFAATNACIHGINALLVAALFSRLFRSSSIGLVVGVVFAIHPGLTEGVAWISQRKTVLATAFTLLSTILFLTTRDSNRSWRPAQYGGALLAYVLSLLCKGMFVTLPVILALLVWFESSSQRNPRVPPSPQGEMWLRGLAVRLVPFFAVACVIALITIWAQRAGGAVRDLSDAPLGERCANVFISLEQYARHFLFPANLSFFYPLPASIDWSALARASAWEVALTAALVRYRARIGNGPLIGWLVFLVSLTPVIGLVQIGTQAHADRYLYGPILGLLILSASLYRFVLERLESNRARLALGALLTGWIVSLTLLAYVQIGAWENTFTLVRSARSTIGTHPQLTGLEATMLMRAHRFDDAAERFGELIASNPRDIVARKNLGVCLLRAGHLDAAEACLQECVEIAPYDPGPQVNLAALYAQTGRSAEALQLIERARSARDLTHSELEALSRIEAVARSSDSPGRQPSP